MPLLYPDKPPPPRCPECRYDLTGLIDDSTSLSHARCPECGQVWDLSQLYEYRLTPPIVTNTLWTLIWILVLALPGIALYVGRPPNPLGPYGYGILILVLACYTPPIRRKWRH